MFEQLSFESLLIFPSSDTASTTKADGTPPTSQSDDETLQRLSLPASSSDAQTLINKGIDNVSDRSVSDSKNVSLTACVNKYSPAKRKTEYFRLSYRMGTKVKHKHIPGGNISSSIAKERAEQLQAIINRGADLSELLNVISSFNS